MSLLDTGNETITVYPQEQTTDDRGNTVWRPSTTGVPVRCRVQPVDSDEPAVPGQATETTYRVIARDAPLGPWVRVEWNGRTWDVIGEPRRYNGSPATRHIDALIRAVAIQ
ncbi:phage head completion protein [Streptomyces boncukensis]|uniref:Head-tail adaptor protein n=1 Tax=Streptomyces boncukensis TaxID=2711219 RepID=A0A6G4X2U0_9ACTN|nr:head-tail adaptor protein [Streptomyces boncukensis]